jgi:hypothetical protein
MKKVKPTVKPKVQQSNPALKVFEDKAASTQKSLAKALESFEKASAVLHELLKKGENKIAILEGQSALKIARFTHKIKKTEHKLAKALLKIAEKDLKKSAQKVAKKMAAVKVAPVKSGKKPAPSSDN